MGGNGYNRRYTPLDMPGLFDTDNVFDKTIIEQIIQWDAAEGEWNYVTPAALGATIDLGDLGDVTYSAPLAIGDDNNVLQYNGVTGVWDNRSDLTIDGEIEVSGDITVNTVSPTVYGNHGLKESTSAYTFLSSSPVNQLDVTIGATGYNNNFHVYSGDGTVILETGAQENAGAGQLYIRCNTSVAGAWVNSGSITSNGAFSCNNTAVFNGSSVSVRTDFDCEGDATFLGHVYTNQGDFGSSLLLIGEGSNELLVAPYYSSIVNTSSAFAIRLTRTPSGSGDYEIAIETGGAIGTATFKWRKDGGAWSGEVTTAPAYTLLENNIYYGWNGSGSFDAADTFSFTADASPTTVFNVDTATPMVTISNLTMGGNLAMGTNDITGAGAITASGVITGDSLIVNGTGADIIQTTGTHTIGTITGVRNISSFSKTVSGEITYGTLPILNNVTSVLTNAVTSSSIAGQNALITRSMNFQNLSTGTIGANSAKANTLGWTSVGAEGNTTLTSAVIQSGGTTTLKTWGVNCTAFDQATYNFSGGSVTHEIVGGIFSGTAANQVFTAGSPTIAVYGGKFTAQGQSGTGTTTSYGITVGSSGSTTNWGIYENSASAYNSLNSDTMIGANATPSYTLEVTGTLGVSGVTTLSGIAYPTDDGDVGDVMTLDSANTLVMSAPVSVRPSFLTPNSISTAGDDDVNNGQTGSVTDVQTLHDGNILDTQENNATVDGTSLRVTFDFTGVTSFHGLLVNAYYNGTASHWINVEAYNYTTTAWDTIFQIPDMPTTTAVMRYVVFPDVDADYIDSGASRVRFNHQGGQVNGHDLIIDYVAITYG